MLKDITLGQYFPGDTLAHRLDPRTKLLATVLYIVAIFLAKGPIAYGVLILTLIVSVRISKVGARALFRGLKPVLFIIAFTAVLNLFYTPGTVIAQFWIFHDHARGCDHRHRHDAAHLAAHHGHLPADLYHQPHPPDRRAGGPARPAEEARRAGA